MPVVRVHRILAEQRRRSDGADMERTAEKGGGDSMNLSDLHIGQTMTRVDLTRPFVGRIVGIDAVGPVNGRPRVLLRSDAGTVEIVNATNLDQWIVLRGDATDYNPRTPDPDDLDPVYCHRCGEYCTEPRQHVGEEWLCEACADEAAPTCAVCSRQLRPAHPRRVLADGRLICLDCNPFRRCGAMVDGVACIGLLRGAGTASDQGRVRCDLCGREGRR